MPIYNAPLLKIDAAETRRYAGMRNTAEFDDEMIESICEEARLLLTVKGIWQIYGYDCEKNLVLSSPKFKIEGESIEKHLQGCEKAVCMAVTVGDRIEQEVTAEFKKGGYVCSMILDAAATCAVEQAADAMEKVIAQEVSKEGYKTIWRYSPGYGDWSLHEQRDFFKITGAKEIGMHLSPMLMLMPRKSITAIIGLKKISADEKNSKQEKNSCATCDKTDCEARKI